MAEETNPLEQLFVDELKDIYNAENQIIKALFPLLAEDVREELDGPRIL